MDDEKNVPRPSGPKPVNLVCPLCSSSDLVVEELGTNEWRYTCNEKKPKHPYTWTPHIPPVVTMADCFPSLLRCLKPGEPFVEYGIVEARFEEVAPKLFAALVQEQGHTSESDYPTSGNKESSASAFLAKALGKMRDRKEVVYKEEAATGRWKRLGKVSYWALPPGPVDGSVLTHEEYLDT